MAWIYLFGLGIVLWGSCGAVMAIGRKLWSLDTTLRVHLAATPRFSRRSGPIADIVARSTTLHV